MPTPTTSSSEEDSRQNQIYYKHQQDPIRTIDGHDCFILRQADQVQYSVATKRLGVGGQGRVFATTEVSPKDVTIEKSGRQSVPHLHVSTELGKPTHVIKRINQRCADKISESEIRLICNEFHWTQLALGFQNVQPQRVEDAIRNNMIITPYDPTAMDLETYAGKSLTWEELLTLARDLLQIGSVLDKLGVSHRDIKPSNILRRQDGSLQLIDWALAQFIGNGEPAHKLGTPMFRGPEQDGRKVTGYSEKFIVDANTDGFAFGVTLIQLLIGPAAFKTQYKKTRNQFGGTMFSTLFPPEIAQFIAMQLLDAHYPTQQFTPTRPDNMPSWFPLIVHIIAGMTRVIPNTRMSCHLARHLLNTYAALQLIADGFPRSAINRIDKVEVLAAIEPTLTTVEALVTQTLPLAEDPAVNIQGDIPDFIRNQCQGLDEHPPALTEAVLVNLVIANTKLPFTATSFKALRFNLEFWVYAVATHPDPNSTQLFYQACFGLLIDIVRLQAKLDNINSTEMHTITEAPKTPARPTTQKSRKSFLWKRIRP